MPTAGTFDISIENSQVISSNYNGISIFSLSDGPCKETAHSRTSTQEREQISKREISLQAEYTNGIVNYKHTTSIDKIFSVGVGKYSEIDKATGSIESYDYHCSGTKCIHDMLSVVADSRFLYMGCDIGSLSYIDRRTHEIVHTEKYAGGITWLSLIDTPLWTGYPSATGSTLEVGTYAGEYSVISGIVEVSKEKLDKIIWRIHKTEIEGKTYNIIAHSYDGIGVYTEQMEGIYTAPTDDLVYTIEIDEKTKTVTGYNYYKGTLIEFSLYDVIHSKQSRTHSKQYMVYDH